MQASTQIHYKEQLSYLVLLIFMMLEQQKRCIATMQTINSIEYIEWKNWEKRSKTNKCNTKNIVIDLTMNLKNLKQSIVFVSINQIDAYNCRTNSREMLPAFKRCALLRVQSFCFLLMLLHRSSIDFNCRTFDLQLLGAHTIIRFVAN